MSDEYDFLRSEDLLVGGEYKKVDIEIDRLIPSVKLTDSKGKTKNNPAIGFKGRAKVLALCASNQGLLRAAIGDGDLAKSVGKKIRLEVREIQVGGGPVVCLRIIPPKGTLVRKGLHTQLGKEACWSGSSPSNPNEGGGE